MKKYMRNKLIGLVSILLFGTSALMAQSNLTIDASQVLTNFRFIDSQGVLDQDYKVNYSGAYNLGYQYQTDFGLIARTGVGMRNGGATLVYDGANYNWSLKYVSYNLGVGYMYGEGLFKHYIVASGYFGYLLKANQTINNQDFDIIDLDQIQNIDFGIIGSLGTQIELNESMSAYTEFSYLMGLQNIETSTLGQESSNVSYMLTLGLIFSL